MQENNKTKITTATTALMIGTALFYDLLSVVPALNWVVLVFSTLTFATWFMIKGVGLINPKKFATWGTSIVVGAVPAVSAIPEITLAVIITIVIVKVEDELGITIPSPTQGKPLRGGRSQTAKIRRRMSHTPERRKEIAERYKRIRQARQRMESYKNQPNSVDGITRRSIWQS